MRPRAIGVDLELDPPRSHCLESRVMQMSVDQSDGVEIGLILAKSQFHNTSSYRCDQFHHAHVHRQRRAKLSRMIALLILYCNMCRQVTTITAWRGGAHHADALAPATSVSLLTD